MIDSIVELDLTRQGNEWKDYTRNVIGTHFMNFKSLIKIFPIIFLTWYTERPMG